MEASRWASDGFKTAWTWAPTGQRIGSNTLRSNPLRFPTHDQLKASRTLQFILRTTSNSCNSRSPTPCRRVHSSPSPRSTICSLGDATVLHLASCVSGPLSRPKYHFYLNSIYFYSFSFQHGTQFFFNICSCNKNQFYQLLLEKTVDAEKVKGLQIDLMPQLC